MDPAFSSNIDAQVMLAFTANYKRVYGKHSQYLDMDVERIQREYEEEEARKRIKPPVERVFAPPQAATTASARELQAMAKMNVPPRHAPCERFAQPLTSMQEVGWGVDQLHLAGKAATTKKH